MKINVKIAIVAFLIVIAVNITVVIIGFAGKSSNSTSTLQLTATATATSTSQPGSTVSPYATPTVTLHPTATSSPSQTLSPTASPTTSKPTQMATPTATQPGATPTPEPTATPTGGGGGGGGTLPTPTPTKTTAPTSTTIPKTIVSISAPSQVNNGNTFTADINIAQVSYLAYAYFDIEYDAGKVSYTAIAPGSIGAATPAITAMLNPSGVQGRLRVIVDFSSYASGNGGSGVSGSGTFCSITFAAVAAGTSPLAFVDGQGTPAGELTLIRWVSYSQSEITGVGWTDGSIAVVD